MLCGVRCAWFVARWPLCVVCVLMCVVLCFSRFIVCCCLVFGVRCVMCLAWRVLFARCVSSVASCSSVFVGCVLCVD